MRPSTHWLAATLLVVGTVCPGEDTKSGTGSDDVTKYVDGRMMAATILHPKRFTQSDLFQALPKGLDLGVIQNELGIDVRHTDRILVTWFPPTAEQLERRSRRLQGGGRAVGEEAPGKPVEKDEFDPEGKTPEEIRAHDEAERTKRREEQKARMAEFRKQPPGIDDIAYVIWLDEPIDRETYLAQRESWQEVEPVKVGERDGFQIRSRDIVVFSEDGKTIFGGPLPVVESFLAAEKGSGPLAERLRAAGTSFDALFVVDLTGLDEVKKVLRMGFDKEGPELPPVFAGVPDAAMKVTAVTMRADVSEKGTLATVRLEAADAEGAEEIKTQLEGALQFGQAMFNFVRVPEGSPPEFGEGVKLAAKAVNGVAVKGEGKEVVVTVPHPEGTVAFVEKLGPMILQAQDAAKRSRFRNNLKNVVISFHNFHATHEAFPAAVAYAGEKDKPLLSWRVAILPMIDEAALFRQFDTNEPWDAKQNKALLEQMPAVFQSPGVTKPGMTTLMMFTGPNTSDPSVGARVAEGDTRRWGMRIRDVTDGTSNTIIGVYAPPEKAVPWTKPVDLVMDPKDPLACVGKIPESGLMVMFCDGSVRTLPADIDAKTFANLVNPSDGIAVELP